MEEKIPLCKTHKMDVILICKNPQCKYELLCVKSHKSHEYEEIDKFTRELIGCSKETLSKVAKICRGEERKQLIKWIEEKKREIEAEYEEMIVQISKVIITKRNIHLKEIEQFLESLKSNINPKLIQISKELIQEGRNILSQETKKKYAEVQRIAQNIIKMKNELEQKMQQELKSDKSKLREEIEGKIIQKEKEFKKVRKLFIVQFKGENVPELNKLELIEEFKGKQVSSAIHKSSNLFPKEAGSNNYLHLLDKNNNNMYIYDIREEKCIQRPITFNKVNKNKPMDSRYIEQGRNLYLSGGTEDYTTSLKRAFILNKENGELREISPMKVPRYAHALVSIYPHYIYAIGGWDCEIGTELSSCEVLDVRSESWSAAPQLRKPKSDIGGCSFDNTYIYIFGGAHERNAVADIEFLDSSHHTSWTPISLTQQHNVFGVIRSVACAQIDFHNIIIYGGDTSSGSYQEKSFILNLNTMKITQHSKLKKRDGFNNNNPVIYENKLYNFGYYYQDIHIFDMKSLEFDIIPKNIWKK